MIEWRRQGGLSPGAVVDIASISGLKGIASDGVTVTIGPLTTHADLTASKVIQTSAPFLAAAASSIGSPQIRNRGTVGGNIMNAAACADLVPPLIALGAEVRLESARGGRVLPLSGLFVKPYVTAALPGEILTEIRFPLPPPGARGVFIKLGRRNAVSIARLSVAAVVERDASGFMTDVRIVPGAAFPTWERVTQAEQILVGRKPSPDLLAAAGRKVSEAMTSRTGHRWSTDYKEPVLAVLVRRALEQCLSFDGDGRSG